MRKEAMTFTQAVFTMILFIFGSSLVVGVSSEAKQDVWLSVLMAAAMAIPVLFVYARIMRLFPETDLFDVLEILFGKVIGRAFMALITWYAIHLCSLVLRNFTEFLQIVSMPETPQLPMMIAYILVTMYLARSGESILGKVSMITFPLVTIVILLTIVMAYNELDYTHLEPILPNGIGKAASGAYQMLTFPFAETVLFLGISGAVSKKISPYKIYGSAILISSFFFLVVVLRNVIVLGVPMITASYFPSYTTARILHIGDFLSRIEGSITINFILAGIIKITLCLIVASKGITKLFAIKNYKRVIAPTGLLAVALGSIVYKSTMEMFGFLKYYQFYAIPFQIMIPIIIWIAAEIRVRKRAPA